MGKIHEVLWRVGDNFKDLEYNLKTTNRPVGAINECFMNSLVEIFSLKRACKEFTDILVVTLTKDDSPNKNHIESLEFYNFQKIVNEDLKLQKIFEHSELISTVRSSYVRIRKEFLEKNCLDFTEVDRDLSKISFAIRNDKTLMEDISAHDFPIPF